MCNLYETLHLRPVNEADDAFLEALYFSRRTDLQQAGADEQFVRQLINMQYRTQLLGIKNTYPQARHLLIENAGLCVGRLVMDVGSADIRVIDLALVPDVQRKGMGKAVLRIIQHEATEKKLDISLSVEKNNLTARALYLKAGFKVHNDDALFEHMRWCRQWENESEQPTGQEHVAA